MFVNLAKPIEKLSGIIKMPDNILDYNRFIYLTRYYVMSDKIDQNAGKKEWVEIDTNGKPISFNPGKIDIIISNYSVTKEKHPENHNLELIHASNLYFGSIYSNDPNIRYNGLKNIKNDDRVVIDDYFYNIIFDYYDPIVNNRNLLESYARTDGIGAECRTLLNTEYKFHIPNPKYYTFSQQMFNEDSTKSISDYRMDKIRDPSITEPEYVAGTVKDLLDEKTKLIEINIKLNEIASFILQTEEKASFLESILFLLSCIKLDMESCGFSTASFIFDSKTESFNIKELKTYIPLDKQRLKCTFGMFAELIDGRLKDIFLSLVCDINLDITLYAYLNKYQTIIHIECDKMRRGTEYIQKNIIEGALCSEG